MKGPDEQQPEAEEDEQADADAEAPHPLDVEEQPGDVYLHEEADGQKADGLQPADGRQRQAADGVPHQTVAGVGKGGGDIGHRQHQRPGGTRQGQPAVDIHPLENRKQAGIYYHRRPSRYVNMALRLL